MYTFCYTWQLREVWALWACWYSPKTWKLRIRSTSPYIASENYHECRKLLAPQCSKSLTWTPRLVSILIYKDTPDICRSDLDQTQRKRKSWGWMEILQTAMITYGYGDREVLGGGGTWKSLLSLISFCRKHHWPTKEGSYWDPAVSEGQQRKEEIRSRRLPIEYGTDNDEEVCFWT